MKHRIALVVPYFGQQPPWMRHYWRNALRLQEQGYQFLTDWDELSFRRRVGAKLGIECPPMAGTGNIWDFRPALGKLYAEELRGYDFWGHTDFDCVYGRVEKFVTDDFLEQVDIHSNHVDYICGCWTLYRNVPLINDLYECEPLWPQFMSENGSHGWAEQEYTTVVDAHHEAGLLRRVYTTWQTHNLNDFRYLKLCPDGRLLEGSGKERDERMMAHFRRTKRYPSGCMI